jgi:hypothetical protein
MKNWKTTGSGILAILTTLFNCFSTKSITPADVTVVVTGIGLILAKDSGVTGAGM